MAHTKEELIAAQKAGKRVQLFQDGEWLDPWHSEWRFHHHPTSYRIVEDEPNKRTHHDLIIAWAKGAEIEYWSNFAKTWERATTPNWREDQQYRIKPEPKPDVVRYARASCDDTEPTTMAYSKTLTFWSVNQTPKDNVKATFDGETNKLKSIELIG